jgi:hypothetical protein
MRILEKQTNATVKLEGAQATASAGHLEVHLEVRTDHNEVVDAVAAHTAASAELSRRHEKVISINAEIDRLRSDRHRVVALLADVADGERSAAHDTVDAIDSALLRLARESEAAEAVMVSAQKAVELADAKRLEAVAAAARAERFEQIAALQAAGEQQLVEFCQRFEDAAVAIGAFAGTCDALTALEVSPIALMGDVIPGGPMYSLLNKLCVPSGWGRGWNFEMRPLVRKG